MFPASSKYCSKLHKASYALPGEQLHGSYTVVALTYLVAHMSSYRDFLVETDKALDNCVHYKSIGLVNQKHVVRIFFPVLLRRKLTLFFSFFLTRVWWFTFLIYQYF